MTDIWNSILPDNPKVANVAGQIDNELSALNALIERLKVVNSNEGDAISGVYSEQMEWARNYNELTWTIASIIIPVSLGGLALTLHNEALVRTALASSGLLFFWVLFAEWHRRLWRRCFELTGIIEELWGLRSGSTGGRNRIRHLLYFRRPRDYGFYLRWFLVILGIFLWATKIGSEAPPGLALILLAVISTILMVCWRGNYGGIRGELGDRPRYIDTNSAPAATHKQIYRGLSWSVPNSPNFLQEYNPLI